MGETIRWTVPDEAGGERLDRHVAAHLDEARNQVRGWIDDGRVRVDGAARRPAYSVQPGETVECDPPPPPVEDRVEPEAGELTILYQDQAVVVLDKPPGLVVHPGAGVDTGTLAHRLLHHFPEMAGVGGPGRPGIVHRLDRDTSGVMVVARNAPAHRALARAFAERRVDKRYLAVVYGDPGRGTVDTPIGRHRVRRQEMAVRRGGRPAVSRYRTLAAAGAAALVEVELLTGRTHQIRVHLKHAGHPLVGDPVYGERRWKGAPAGQRPPLERFGRPALHAWRLTFPHPEGGQPSFHQAPVADDFAELWRSLGGGEPATVLPETPAESDRRGDG